MMASMNAPEILAAHKQRTGDKVVTRFPPEPNGYLHIGHCKAMRFSFKIASDYGGYTYLRYDDTNPEAESQEYIDSIKNSVEWLGYKPRYITYASDYFPKIYDIAIQLIKIGKAFVCKLSKEEAKQLREQKKPSPYRDTPPEVNLKEFKLMSAGYYGEGDACLRAKIDYTNPNPTLRDPTIYRIKYTPHPHVGNRWCVYPLYDFVHSLCDNFEDITHSLCTLEFENRRDLYYWSLNELNMYKPYVWEFSRLNITNNVLSKRKILKMIQKKYIDGWDDPRLLTIVGIKRRGYPPEALNNFCDLISVTRRGNDNVINFALFEHCVRAYLKDVAKSVQAVIEPVEIEITNLESESEAIQPSFCHQINVTKFIYLDKDDVRMIDSPEFYGLAPNKIVRLRFGPFIKALEVIQEGNQIVRVKAVAVKEEEIPNKKAVKGVLHFLSKEHAINCEVRAYDKLFLEEFPGEKTGDILDDFNHKSKVVFTNSKVHKGILNVAKVEERFQFERVGFFNIDYDSKPTEQKLVFNKIVSLKDRDKVKNLSKGTVTK